MKLAILAVLVASAVARPDVSHLLNKQVGNDAQAEILKQTLDVNPESPGKYYWEYETNNGIAAHEHGENTPDGELVGGKAGWISPEGVKILLSYTADQNGYRPEGDHLPTPPPIPEAILRSLEWIAAHPPPPERAYRA